MSKSILLSIKPEWVAKILNGEKTIEVRKLFRKDYVGWIYMYCSKGKPRVIIQGDGVIAIDNKHYSYGDEELNGKVVARFWCDKVDEIHDISIMSWYHHYIGDFYNEDEICKCSCLTWQELGNYLKGNNGYAIHISKLEIFYLPKKLSEFVSFNSIGIPQYQFELGVCVYKKVTKAPQSWCYVEVESNE